LHTSSPPLLLPSTSHRVDVLEVTLPPQKRLCISLGLRFKVGESSSVPTARPTGGFRADYGFEDPEEDLTNYLIDGGDDDDNDDGSSDDDEDDDDVEEDEDEEEEEEEHPTPTDSISPPSVYRTTSRISIPV
nr:hypothetical protein [Tanacetum cinerariifolium]